MKETKKREIKAVAVDLDTPRLREIFKKDGGDK
jgi:hypothetical protein